MKINRKQFIQSSLITAGAVVGLEGCSESDPAPAPATAGTAGTPGVGGAGTGGSSAGMAGTNAIGGTGGNGGDGMAGSGGTGGDAMGGSGGTGGDGMAGSGGTGGDAMGGSGGGGGSGGAASDCETPMGMVQNAGGGSGHSHPWDTSTLAADIAAGVEKMYLLEDEFDHEHMLLLTADDFMMLQQGINITKPHEEDNTNHTHDVTITCGPVD